MATIQIEVPAKERRSRASSRAPRPASGQTPSRGLNWGRLVAEGRAARASADSGRWRIGHLASLVAKQYGSRSLQQFAEDICEAYSTVRRYRWVATRYEPTIRFRFRQLSFSHFQAVAGLPDRVKWLGRAETGCWSVDRLIKESRLPVRGSSRRTKRDALRAPLREAATQLARLSALDDAEISRTATWLEPALDELSEEIDRVRGRLRRAKGVRTGRYAAGSNGNGHRARARTRA